jgi:23S rRNA (adenine2030-N6)-methyltransferase
MRRVPSRYRPEAAPDYSHRFHAGNVGDVWKHCVLVEVLQRAGGSGRHVTYVESHAGEGGYALGPTGDWTEGIGRLWRADAGGNDAVGRYVALVRRLGAGPERPERYPGSPVLARAVLGRDATLALWERDAAAAARLTGVLDDPDTRVMPDDGLAALVDALAGAEARRERVVALVDPPFTQKPDWIAIPDVVIAAAQATRHATILLWYPVKSLTRPNAMITRFRAAGVSATVAELITTPLEHQRQRLNGSGLVLIRPPDGAVATVAAAAPVIGAACATRAGVWSCRFSSW